MIAPRPLPISPLPISRVPTAPSPKAITPAATDKAASDKAAIAKAAQGFEAVFLREMIGSMRKAKLAEDIFGSSATDNFREMADARTADAMAAVGAFGIAALVERQLAPMTRGKP